MLYFNLHNLFLHLTGVPLRFTPSGEKTVRLQRRDSPLPHPASAYLETYMVLVCRFEVTSNSALIRSFHGTAFFVNDAGVFITARHVVEKGSDAVAGHGGFLGLCVRPPGGAGNVAAKILSFDHADPPYDVSIGTCNGSFPTLLTVKDADVATWRDVATFGYPETALNISPQAFWIYGRGFKGYVHRLVKFGELPAGGHPNAFEVSFAMPPGLSGAPLFLHSEPRDVVVGVCVGANRAETVDFDCEEILESGEIRRERRLRVEEYGIAHDLRPLLDWKPPALKGLTVADVANVG